VYEIAIWRKAVQDNQMMVFLNKITEELLGFWTFSIVWYSREHDFSETGSVSVQ
jgi:hypothetical protein